MSSLKPDTNRQSDPDCRQHLVTADGELREKNQITVPKRVMEILHFRVGDHLIFVADECDPNAVHIHRLPDSYAGALAGVYGTATEVQAYLRAEGEAWGE